MIGQAQAQVQAPVPAIGLQDVPPPIPEELYPPSDELLRGQLAAVRLPVGHAEPTQSAWCSVSNLVAVALAPEPNSTTAQILVIEPSNPEDCTALELPVAGPGDYVSSLEWSGPGQRRALLCGTASGRVVAWTQPSQQGQDDSMVPRCIDDWHGQLLLDLSAPNSGGGGGGSAGGGGGAGGGGPKAGPGPGPHIKQEPGLQAQQSNGVQVKQEPASDAAGSDHAAGDAAASLEEQQQQQRQGWMQPALACVCWLRQPAGGRVWSTAALATKRLDGGGGGGGSGGGGVEGGGGVGENFDSLFSEPPAPGAVPHWARPHQLTAAVLTADGRLSILWALASKLPNTISWHRSRTLNVPPPPPAAPADTSLAEADTGGGGGGGAALPPEWRIACGSAAALHDGSLALAAVYDKRRADGVYLYGMRGNPTLGGTPVGQPGGGGGAAAAAVAAAHAPTIAYQTKVAVRENMSVRQCQLHVSGASTRRLFVLGQERVSVAEAAAAAAAAAVATPTDVYGAAAAAALSPTQGEAPVAAVASFRAEPDGSWRCEGYSAHLGWRVHNNGASAAAVVAPLHCTWQPPQSVAGAPSATDYVLEAGGRTFPCHRAVLASRCEYFRRLGINGDRRQSGGAGGSDGDGVHFLYDADPNALALLLHSMYDSDGDGSACADVPAPLAPAVAALAERLGLAEAAAAAAGVAAAVGPRLRLSADGAKVAVSFGAAAYVLDSESLQLLAAEDLANASFANEVAPATELGAVHGGVLQPIGGGAGSCPAADGGGGGTDPWVALSVPAAAACLSPHAACLCTVTLRRRPRRQQRGRGVWGGGAAAAGGPGPAAAAAADGLCDMEVDGANGTDGAFRIHGFAAAPYHGHGMYDGDGSDADDTEDEEGGWAEGVFLGIRTVPDVTSEAEATGAEAGAGSHPGESLACRLDAMRLAWGVLHRQSLWDVAERLRCCWLSGGPAGRSHVAACLGQLDGLLYGQDAASRVALAPGVSRAKLEVLRRLPDPAAARAAGDLLAGARVLQYSAALALLYNQGGEALSHPELRSMAAHMVWFVWEVLTLMLAGLRIWAEEAAATHGSAAPEAGASLDGGGAAAGGGGGATHGSAAAPADSVLPLVRLYPDYNMQKLMHVALFGSSFYSASKGGADGGRGRLSMHPAVQEQLGGPEVLQRVRGLVSACLACSDPCLRQLTDHLNALEGKGAAVPGAPVGPVSEAAVAAAKKAGELPRPLLHRSLQALFPGPFHVHASRTKGLITPAVLAQALGQDSLKPFIRLSREAILERYAALGLTAQLTDPRVAPHAAARRLWMSFRAPAPAPELHAHVLAQQHVSSRQRQRWRRQRGAALALGGSAPLWSHSQGVLPDCLTGAPLPPGASWALEGASAAGAVTTQLGPGGGGGPGGGSGGRPGGAPPPPLLASLQRAWLGCAPPAELGSAWKRARLGLQQDMRY